MTDATARPPIRRLVPICARPARARAQPAAVGALVGGVPRSAPPTEIRPRIPGIQPLSHEVYGYLPVLASRLGHGRPDQLRPRLDDRVLRARHQVERSHRPQLGRLQGIRRRGGRGRHQRRPRPRRPGRAHVPALRLEGRLPEDDQVPEEPRGPGPVHRRGARPDGRAQGGRRRSRLRSRPGR